MSCQVLTEALFVFVKHSSFKTSYMFCNVNGWKSLWGFPARSYSLEFRQINVNGLTNVEALNEFPAPQRCRAGSTTHQKKTPQKKLINYTVCCRSGQRGPAIYQTCHDLWSKGAIIRPTYLGGGGGAGVFAWPFLFISQGLFVCFTSG